MSGTLGVTNSGYIGNGKISDNQINYVDQTVGFILQDSNGNVIIQSKNSSVFSTGDNSVNVFTNCVDINDIDVKSIKASDNVSITGTNSVGGTTLLNNTTHMYDSLTVNELRINGDASFISENSAVTNSILGYSSVLTDLYIGYLPSGSGTTATDLAVHSVKFVINNDSDQFFIQNNVTSVDIETRNVEIADNAIILADNQMNSKVGIYINNDASDDVGFIHTLYDGTNGAWVPVNTNLVVTNSSNLNFLTGNGTDKWSMAVNESTSNLEFSYNGNTRIRLIPSSNIS